MDHCSLVAYPCIAYPKSCRLNSLTTGASVERTNESMAAVLLKLTKTVHCAKGASHTGGRRVLNQTTAFAFICQQIEASLHV